MKKESKYSFFDLQPHQPPKESEPYLFFNCNYHVEEEIPC